MRRARLIILVNQGRVGPTTNQTPPPELRARVLPAAAAADQHSYFLTDAMNTRSQARSISATRLRTRLGSLLSGHARKAAERRLPHAQPSRIGKYARCTGRTRGGFVFRLEQSLSISPYLPYNTLYLSGTFLRSHDSLWENEFVPICTCRTE